MSAGTLPMRMLLLVAVTPPAVAYVAPSPLLRPQAVAAAGQTLSRGGILRGGAQGNVRRRPQAQGTLRSSVFPLPLAHASHGIRLARGAHGLRMAASTTGEAAAVSQEAPEELPLQVVKQEGRLVTATLAEDMTGSWLLQGRRVVFDGGAGGGTVLWQRIPLVFILNDDTALDAASCSTVVIQPGNATMLVSDAVLGKELDALGRDLSSSETAASASDKGVEDRAIFGVATQMADLATISRPMHTGITAVDALTPIGKGQNMLIVGAEDLGRRRLVLDAAATQVAKHSPRGDWTSEHEHAPCGECAPHTRCGLWRLTRRANRRLRALWSCTWTRAATATWPQ